eukprot:gi/632943713/ref/XP_007887098.1/ PREDICTED: dual specificity mitogen-activated protein kinase kinase 6 [Callorhinchus milii]
MTSGSGKRMIRQNQPTGGLVYVFNSLQRQIKPCRLERTDVVSDTHEAIARKKKNPGLKLSKEVFEPQASPTAPRDLDSKACISVGEKSIHPSILPSFQGDVWICMELMDTSLDKFYKQVIDKGMNIPEDILGKIAVSIVKALEHLHSKLSVIHRDVKPSNVLINTQGQVKMCDFGISGYLVDSVAKTMDAGCKPYMAVSSDHLLVGSLKKNSKDRPTYSELMQHPFFTLHECKETDVASFVKLILD